MPFIIIVIIVAIPITIHYLNLNQLNPTIKIFSYSHRQKILGN